jgi:hypothetical protein
MTSKMNCSKSIKSAEGSNYPVGLPKEWYSAWDYCFHRPNSSRALRQGIILELIKNNIIDRFNSNTVFSGDIVDEYINYMGGIDNIPESIHKYYDEHQKYLEDFDKYLEDYLKSHS